MTDPVRQFGEELAAARDEVNAFTLTGSNDPKAPAATRLASEQLFALRMLTEIEQRVNGATTGDKQDRQARYGVRYIWRIVGQFAERAQQIDVWPFAIDPPADDKTDINIQVRDVPISAEAVALKRELFAALNIMRSVIEDRGKRVGPIGRAAKLDEVNRLSDTYMRDLRGIAEVGLMTSDPSHVSFARSELGQFKARFTMREAGKVKNDYVKTLLVWSSLAILFFLLAYWAIRTYAQPIAKTNDWANLLYDLRNFNLLAAGTAAGTWLSFSLRKQELSFEDLAVLEPDRLDPWVRVLYMTGLATLIGLLLFSGAVVFGVGKVDGLMALHGYGSWALLVGMLAGVAERALGSAVSARATEFAGAVGGAGPPTTKVNV